jgi:hypothetical protein
VNVQHKTLSHGRTTLRSELSPGQINEPLFTGRYSQVCLRYVNRHCDSIDPFSLLEIEDIDHVEDPIDCLVTAYNEKQVADFRAICFGSFLRTPRTHFPHEFRGLAMQAIECHLFAYPRRDPLRQYLTKDFLEDAFLHPFSAI